MRRRQDGVAIALVVWFLAGMSLLVAGIVSHARVDAGMTQLHLARAKTVAAGDGAIALAMLERLESRNQRNAGPISTQSNHVLGDVSVQVRLIPSSGLVNLNTAPREILTGLFALGAGTDAGQAQILADNVVQWRQPEGAGRNRRVRGGRRFNALEDLLRVDGITRSQLDAIRDYVVVGPWASGGINWNSSTEQVMQLLDDANPERAETVRQRRDNMERTPGRNTGRTVGGGETAFRADALVEYGGRTWLRRRWVTLDVGANSDLPWRIVRTEPPRVIGPGMRNQE